MNSLRPASLIRVSVSFAAIVALAACSGATKLEGDLGIKGAPDWVNQGSQAVNDKKGRLIHGVGSAPDLGDQSLQVSTADNRARAEIARVLSSYLDVALNDYLGSNSAAAVDGKAATDASIQQQINGISQVTLNGAKIINRWKDTRTDIVYAFAELDVKRIKDVVAANQGMSEDLKRYLLQQGDAVFDNFAGDHK
jgi:hypothetical protein